MDGETEKSRMMLSLARRDYDRALIHYKRAKEEYERIDREMKKYRQQIRSDGYYSISGIKVDIPFLASTDRKAGVMLELAGEVGGKRVVDLGCGDGKILEFFAKAGAKVAGYELEPSLIDQAEERLVNLGADFCLFEENFLQADLGKYDIVTIYGITSLMEKLEKKLQKELRGNALVISNTFPFPNWNPIEVKDNVFLYTMKVH